MSERAAYYEAISAEKLREIKASSSVTVSVEDVATIIGSGPQDIRIQAQKDPSKLGFPVIVHGSRVKIPRLGFLHFLEYGWSFSSKASLTAEEWQ